MHDYLQLALAEGFGEGLVPAMLAPDLDPRALLAAPLDHAGIPPRVRARLLQPGLSKQAADLCRRANDLGLSVLTPADPGWPSRFAGQPLRPLVLFARGAVHALSRAPAVALVGSRTPTPYGDDAARHLCAVLAVAGATLWSGLARGIDAVAHQACVHHGTPTVAVLAGGLDAIYPPEHAVLADRIVAAGGCLVSELPPGRRARRGHFVRRNRLLAMGAAAVIVIEGSLASGALHTARFAADCGTDVFALPGPWMSERSQGCHRLIAEGAGIIESPDELLRALGFAGETGGETALARVFAADEQQLRAALRGGPRPTDLLQRESGMARSTFLRTLHGLEQRGSIERLPGDLWRLAR